MPYGQIREIEIDSSGSIILAGDFDGRMDLGGGVLESAGGGDVFVAKLTPAGDFVWQRRFGDESIQVFRGLSLDSSDRIALAGHFRRTIDFGGGKYRSSSHVEDVFVGFLAPDGSHLFSHLIANDLGSDEASDIVVDDEGSLFVSGIFRGALADLFLMKLRTADPL
jgi:hypothetical protein